MAITSYPRLIREKGKATVRELDPYGFYRAIPTAKEFEKRGLKWGDVSEYAPGQRPLSPYEGVSEMYKPLEEETGAYYDTMSQELEKRLKGEYAQRGFLDSTEYLKAFQKQGEDVGRQRASALAQLALQKLGTVGTHLGYAREGERFGWEREEAKTQREYEAKQQKWDMFYKLLAALT